MKRTCYPWLRPVGFLLSVLASVGVLSPNRAVGASGNVYLITSNPELEAATSNFGGFLRELGYNVEVEPPGGGPFRALDAAANAAELIAQLTTNDLVIIHRNFGSATLASTPAEVSIWNNLDVPVLLCNAPIVRNDRWLWINGASGSAQASRNLSIVNPDHPIVAGLDVDLFEADRSYGGIINGADGGPHLHQIAAAIVPPFSPICLAVWDESNGETRSFYESGGQTYHRRRVFFEMHEYRNGGDWGEVTSNGRRMWANAIAYAMTGQVPPEPPQIVDVSPAAGSTFNSAATSLSFRANSSQPVEPEGIRVVVNGADVSAGLQITGAATSRLVTHEGLSANQVYDVEITVTNLGGSRSLAIQFDTFKPSDVQTIASSDQTTFSDFVPAGVYQVYLQASSASAQDVGLLETFGVGETQLRGVVYVSSSTMRIVPLTDALGRPALLRNTNEFTALEVLKRAELTLGNLFLVTVTNPPAALPPVLARVSPVPNQTEVASSASLMLTLANRDTEVSPGSVRLFLDGQEVTGKAGFMAVMSASGVELHYDPPGFLAPSTTHTVSVSFDDAGSVNTVDYLFQTVSMPAVPAALRSPLNAGRFRGFNLLVHMAAGNPDNVFTNTSARAQLQLAGVLLGPSGPVTNVISGTPMPSPYSESNVLNYNRVLAETGQFAEDVLFPFGEVVTPSLIALEATAFLALQAGVHHFGVRSDDGFKLTVGGVGDVVLGVYEGPRGDQVPTEFDFLVYETGLYPVRLLYYDGGGGASLEFYSIHEEAVDPTTGGRVLINGEDMEGDARVFAYREIVPRLTISRQGNEVVVEWISSMDVVLEQNDELGVGDWSPVLEPPEIVGGFSVLRLTVPLPGNRFFRLVSQ